MSLADFQMSVLQLMREKQEEELNLNRYAEVCSFGTGYFVKALGLKRFSDGHHKQMQKLVNLGWVHMWQEKNGKKYFALKYAALINLQEKINHANRDMWRTGIRWGEWDAGKNEPPPFGDPYQHLTVEEVYKGVPDSEKLPLDQVVEEYKKLHPSNISASGEFTA